jgi:hypothetical protein
VFNDTCYIFPKVLYCVLFAAKFEFFIHETTGMGMPAAIIIFCCIVGGKINYRK